MRLEEGRRGGEGRGGGVGGLDGAGTGDEARVCGREREGEFGVSGRVCGVDMAAEGRRVGAIIRGAAVRPEDERSSGSGQERWLVVPDTVEVR